jgi:hypothetical protein
MSEHQNKACVAATYWCAKCHAATLHNVADGRKAGCQVCIAKLQPEQKPAPAQQESLFR